jgi:hypothetical protein
MPERRPYRPSPYQLPFDYGAHPLDLGQHVRVLSEPYIVRQPADAAHYLLNQVYIPFEQFKQEQLFVLLLDNQNLITHDVMVYKGTVNSIYVRAAELFMEAVKVNAPSIILSHCQGCFIASATLGTLVRHPLQAGRGALRRHRVSYAETSITTTEQLAFMILPFVIIP